jgi:hypothetical protein
MRDEGNGSYYLTETETLFREVEKIDMHGTDEDLMEFMYEHEADFEVVYDLAGIGVIEQVTGYFY